MSTKELTHISLQVKGMTCNNCALGVEKYLKKEGLESVHVDFSLGEVEFNLTEGQKIPLIIKGIEGLGYEVMEEEEDESSPKAVGRLEKFFIVSAIFTFPLLLHMFLSWHWLHNPWVQLMLCLPVFAIGMYYFGSSAWKSLQTGVPNMDVLITMGALAAFVYSLYGTLMNLGMDFLFYETSASIITLVLLGNLLEERAVKKTTSAIRELTELQPKHAFLLRVEEGVEVLEEVLVSSLKSGDILQVNEGGRVPIDGKILAGNGEIDESMITGESLPVHKAKGKDVIGGTILRQGNIQVKVNRTGEGTVLAQIIQMVKKAQKDKPQIQELADKISAIFVPVVIGIALLTFLLSYFLFDIGLKASLIHSIAVLVISCPCAMGLATPTAVIVGIGRAGRQGILIKGARSLEKFSQIKRLVLDKTGTLTDGAFRIEQIQCREEDRREVEQTLRSMELYSSHPIAVSIQQELAHVGMKKLLEVREEKGVGMTAKDEHGNVYKLGSFRVVPKELETDVHDLYLLKNEKIWATVDLVDRMRTGAREMVSYYQNQGIEVVMLSGDRKETCEKLAQDLGIKKVYAEQLPQDKLKRIVAFSEEGPLAMMGDGINDAPALARADIGISLAKATEIAMHSAEIILSGTSLQQLIKLHKVSRHTIKTIRQNLFWAFFYNVLAIPLAAVGFLKPILAAATMALSDVVVIGNSLRLRIKRLS